MQLPRIHHFYHATVIGPLGTRLALQSLLAATRSGERHENLSADDAYWDPSDSGALHFCAETAVKTGSTVDRSGTSGSRQG
jgi:hypothetical protein